MPPKRYFVAKRVTEEDEKEADAFMEEYGSDADAFCNLLEDLEAFMDANDQFPGESQGRILELFVNQCIACDLFGTTIAGRLAMIKSNQVDVRRLAVAKEAFLSRRIHVATARYAATLGLKREKPLFSLGVLWTPFYAAKARRETSYRRLRYRSFWYLLIATGNRAWHVAGIRALRITRAAVGIKWGPRKVRVTPPTDYVWYPFSWTQTPPEEVYRELRDLGRPIFDEETAASDITEWIECLRLGLSSAERAEEGKDGCGVTSGSPRVHLTNALAPRVEAGEISREVFADLIDHTYATSIATYGRRAAPSLLAADKVPLPVFSPRRLEATEVHTL